MSSKLQSRLREFAPQMGHYGAYVGGELMEQAADEIGRLNMLLHALPGPKPADDPGLPAFATVRMAVEADGDNVHSIECRFQDGQKFAAVHVEDVCETLAYFVRDAINGRLPPEPRGSLSATDYEQVLGDHRRLVRELDVALNGAGAAKQASLCDIVGQVTDRRWKLVRADEPGAVPVAEVAAWHDTLADYFCGEHTGNPQEPGGDYEDECPVCNTMREMRLRSLPLLSKSTTSRRPEAADPAHFASADARMGSEPQGRGGSSTTKPGSQS